MGGGGFSASSRNIHLVDGHRLRAECRNERGDYISTELDLNTCIGNLNGKLAWDTPNFSHTAEGTCLVNNGAKLDSTLREVSGQQSQRQGINLDDRIVNRNGSLYFIPHNEVR